MGIDGVCTDYWAYSFRHCHRVTASLSVPSRLLQQPVGAEHVGYVNFHSTHLRRESLLTPVKSSRCAQWLERPIPKGSANLICSTNINIRCLNVEKKPLAARTERRAGELSIANNVLGEIEKLSSLR